MNANKWYSIAQTTVFDTSCGINITFGDSSSVLFTASVKYGVSSLNISSCSIEESYNISVRLRETESKWCVDLLSNIEINPTIDITDSPYWIADNSLAGNGAVIAIIENISKEFNTTGGGGSGEGGESLFDRINIGTDANPQYAVVPKDFNGSYVHILSRGDVLAGGEGTPGEPGQGATTLGGLNNVDAGADEIYNTDKVLVKPSLGSHWRVIDLSSVVGLDTNALERYLTTNNYATISDIETAIGPVSDKVNGFNDRIAILESLGLSLVEQDGTTYLKSEHSFFTEKDIFAGGLGEEGPSSCGIIQQVYGASAFGGTFDSNNLTDTFNAHAINSLYTTIQRGVKNPYALTINGTPYDGSSAVDITISGGGGGVSGDYLPLSGGTLKGDNDILKITGVNNSYILFSLGKTNSASVGYYNNLAYIASEIGGYARIGIADDGTPQYWTSYTGDTKHTLIHSGNYSSYALPLSGGRMANNAGISWSYNIHSWDDAVDGFECISVLNGNSGYWSGFSYKGYYGLQMRAYGGNTDYIQVRGFNHENWGTWRDIIHSGNIGSYNAGSATKLQTARTIWGQSFDGTRNVSGKLTNATAISFDSDCGVYQGSIFSSSMSKYDIAYYGTNHYFHNFSSGYNLIIKENGNILMGTTTDWGYRLGVKGAMFIAPNGDHGILIGAQNNTIDGWRVNGNSTDLCLNWQSTGAISVGHGGGNVLIGSAYNSNAKLKVGINRTDNGWLWTSGNLGSYSDFTIEQDDKYGLYTRIERGAGDFGMQVGRSDGNALNYNLLLQPVGGNVLIGTTTDNGAKLQVSGNLTTTGDVTAGSDARYKRIESYAEIDIETIANAPIINFKWTDREDDRVHLGSTAQYWANTSLCNGVIPTDDEKLWTMNYGTIALGAVVGVAKKVVSHEDEIRQLKGRVSKLENELKQYRRLS